MKNKETIRACLYELIKACISVKGVFFFTTLSLVYLKGLDPVYAFLAGGLWVGARQLVKHFLENKNLDSSTKSSGDKGV